MDPERWGQYAVVKPLRGSMGRNVYLVPTTQVIARYAELTLNETREMVVQPYIEHSENGYPTEYRVLTLFGKVLYSARNSWGMPRRPLEEIAADPNGIIASNDKHFGRVRTVSTDPDVIRLGERAHMAFPQVPVLGVDVVREAGTGALYAMEVNPAGDTWHLSSLLTKNFFTPEHTQELYAQFNALDRVAQLLIEKTRAEAT
jgi:glutathione synthase/RimK-type ligase-like ATP-grasp enzyme